MIDDKGRVNMPVEHMLRMMSRTPDRDLMRFSRSLIRRGQSKARVQAVLNEYVRQKRAFVK